MSAHSRLPPSGASAWANCPGWVRMAEAFPEHGGDSEASIEGTAAHWVHAQMLHGLPVFAGQVDPDGTVIDEDMIEAASIGAAHVLSVVATYQAPAALVIETPVAIPRVHELCWGTPDVWCFDRAAGILDVWDFKYGHRFVEVFENLQLGPCYASGILDQLGIDGLTEQHIRVRLHIVQPRSYHRDGSIRTWECFATDLRPLVNKLAAAALEALSEDPAVRVGPYCGDCAGRHACRALQLAALTACDVAAKSTPFQLPPNAVGWELRALKRALEMIEARISGLETEAFQIITKGGRIPFWCVQQSNGRERWTAPADQVIAMGQMFGKDLAKPLAPITPKQARLLVDESVISAYCETPRGALKLVPYNETQIKKVFT